MRKYLVAVVFAALAVAVGASSAPALVKPRVFTLLGVEGPHQPLGDFDRLFHVRRILTAFVWLTRAARTGSATFTMRSSRSIIPANRRNDENSGSSPLGALRDGVRRARLFGVPSHPSRSNRELARRLWHNVELEQCAPP